MRGKADHPATPQQSATAPRPEKRGSAGPRAIAEMAARLTRKPFGKHGFAEGALIANWAAVVGPLLAATTLPLKIAFPRGERSGGTLHVRVASGAMATQLQHLEPVLLQRINGHFGYGAVARLAITQGPVPRRPARQPPAPPALSGRAERALAETVAPVDDDRLRAALAALGRRLVKD